MAYITLNGDRLKLGSQYIILGAVSASSGPVGDGYGFRSAGAARKFWSDRADKWVEDNLPRLERAKKAKRPKTVIVEVLTEAQAIPDLPIGQDALAAFLAQLAAPQPDYTAIATALLDEIARAMAPIRRRRDNEAILVLSW